MSGQGPRSLKQLLDASGRLKELRQGSEQRRRITSGARALLPPELAPHLVAATVNNDELVLVFDSPVWASRARYMHDHLLAAASEFHIRAIRVRVSPGSA